MVNSKNKFFSFITVISKMNESPENLINQIQLYITELRLIQERLRGKRPKLAHVQLLQSKIKIKIAHFQTSAHQVRFQNHSHSALQTISSYLSKSFSQIVKEAHRILQIKGSESSSDKIKNKLNFLSQMEEEMNVEWQAPSQGKENHFLKRINENTSMIADHVDQTQLKSIAKDCLNKQFLAIRMVAFRMYERYTNHTHQSTLQQMQKLAQQQENFQREIEQLSSLNKNLKSEEKRLVRQLNQLKRTNELIANRYFTQSPELKE